MVSDDAQGPMVGTPGSGATVACAGGIVCDDLDRLLLVRRSHEPGRGLWSVPGGRVEPGEPATQAAIREVREETGLDVRVVRLAGTVERPGAGGATYVIDDFVCAVMDGQLAAGDDADEVGWFTPAEVRQLPTVPLLIETLIGWGLLDDG